MWTRLSSSAVVRWQRRTATCVLVVVPLKRLPLLTTLQMVTERIMQYCGMNVLRNVDPLKEA